MQVSYNNALHPALQRVQQLVNQIGWPCQIDGEDLYLEIPLKEPDRLPEPFQVAVAAESPELVLVVFASESIFIEPDDAASWALVFLAEHQNYLYGHWAMDRDEDGFYCYFHHRINMQHVEHYELELLLLTMTAAVADFRDTLLDQQNRNR